MSQGTGHKKSMLASFANTRTAWRRISPFFKGSRGRLILISVVSVIAGLAQAILLTLLAAVAMSIADDTKAMSVKTLGLHLSGSRDTFLITALALAAVFGVLQLWLAYLPAKMSGQAMADLRQRLFDAFINADWATKASEREGGFQSLMIQQINATAQMIITISSMISAALMFVTLLASAVAISPAAAVVIAVASALLFMGLRPLARDLRRSSSALSAEGIEYSKTTQEVASMAEETNVFGASASYRESFYRHVRAVQEPFQHTRFMAGAVPALYQSVALLVLVLALFVVSLLGGQSIASLGAVVLMLVRAVSYGQNVQTSITTIDEKVPFMLHLADAIEGYESNAEAPGSLPLSEIHTLEMKDVRFSYPNSPEVLRGMTFNVAKGEIIGVVGPSGAGKSTLVQMLLKLRDPSSGEFLVNGLDATQVLRSDWHKLVAYLPQMPQLFYGTVADNIRFFRDVTDEEIVDAAKRSHVHDEILAMPNGYETIVGQRAATVSGGEAQRICLARALVANPTVVILDEPTSALDVKSEEFVQESLRQLSGHSIVFLVAHRLSTLAICNRVMVVNNGRLEAFDTAERLVGINRFFHDVTAIAASSDASLGSLGMSSIGASNDSPRRLALEAEVENIA